jgi:hypothetical protein
MSTIARLPVILSLAGTLAFAAASLDVSRPAAAAAAPAQGSVAIPPSLRIEHEAIHAGLVEATTAPGRVGAAARELASVLHPHFVREEEIALPPLGLLAPLASGAAPAGTDDALAMSDTLRKELPRMLEEHVQIRAAVATLQAAAKEERAEKYEQLAEELALHAKTEEEVLYPAAVLVGDLIRAKRSGK